MPDFSQSAVSIAIRSWNGRELLEECLPSIVEALAHRKNPDDEICVVDDGSTDGTFEFLQTRYPRIRSYRQERSGSPTAANRAILSCKNEIVLMMDNDVKLEKGFIDHALPHFNDPKVFSVTMRALAFDKMTFRSGGQVGRFKRGFLRAWENYDVEDRETNPLVLARQLDTMYSVTAHTVFRRSLFEKLGGFDTLYYPTYWEDTEIGFRAWKMGYVNRYEPRALAYHRLHGTAGKLPKHENMALASERNRLIFHWKNISDPLFLAQHLFTLFFRLIFSLLTLKKSFVVPFYQAVTMLPLILAKRAEEKKHWVLTDREILRKPIETLKKLGA
ncbi:MAG: glycosyltransferase [Nitrospinae bacterium]|nr:glycosyltransferase [Nitrospinota bacterium]